MAGERGHAFENSLKMPSAIVAGEGVNLVDHDDAQMSKESSMVDSLGDEQELERFGGAAAVAGFWAWRRLGR